MQHSKTYHGTECRFEDLLKEFKKSNVCYELVLRNNEDFRNEERSIYLVKDVAIRVTTYPAASSMAVNDDVSVELIGEENSNISKIEDIVKKYFE